MDEQDVRGQPHARSKSEASRAPAGRREGGSSFHSEALTGILQGDWPPLLTASEVAIVLRTSRKAIYAMAERAQLPGVTRIGRRLLVHRDDLLSWLEERRAAAPTGTRR